MSQANIWEFLAKAEKPMTKEEISKEFNLTKNTVQDTMRRLQMRRVLKVTTKGQSRNQEKRYELNSKGRQEA